MITLFSGTPGSGKSLHVAKLLLEKITYQKKLIITNYPVNLDFIKRSRCKVVVLDNQTLTCDMLEWISSRWWFKGKPIQEGGIICVIDEAQLLFNAREWSKSGRSDWISLFTQQRKYGIDFYLIAQFDRMLDRQIRSLIEYEYVHRKMSNCGFWGRFYSALLGGKVFVAVKRWYPLKERIGAEYFRFRKKYGKFYDTHTLFH